MWAAQTMSNSTLNRRAKASAELVSYFLSPGVLISLTVYKDIFLPKRPLVWDSVGCLLVKVIPGTWQFSPNPALYVFSKNDNSGMWAQV